MSPGHEPETGTGEGPSFEDALTRLETIVDQLESGELTLEDSLRRYEEGMKLSKRLTRTLDEAEQTIQRLEASGDEAQPLAPPPPVARPGKPRTRPMELETESKSGESELPF